MKAVLEHIRPEETHSFYVKRYSQRRFTCPYHYHPEVELTLIVRGDGQKLVGDHLRSFSPGDLSLMGSNLPHSYFHPSDYQRGPKGAESIVVQFKPEMGNGFLTIPECKEFEALLKRASQGMQILEPTRSEVVRIMEKLVEAQKWRRWTLLLEALGILSETRDYEILASEIFVPSWNQRQSKRIERVCTWVTGHFQEPITLDEAAKQAHMSPPAFSRFFKRATNNTFTHFVNELRIGFASRRLLETDLGISEIAFEAGFENLSNFNRRFLEFRSTTPREYRAQARMSSE